ncbi:diguanylate cyclase domain-containing protein [Spiribacter insolitus]|uniref:Sensor domain-containing diguanylate cyclase n=1 Tax=Spiribacter insolitus TaxID=3122417 RepID=A0ABV3T6A6_9GAMM
MRQLVSTGMEARLRRYIVSLLTLFAIGSTTATAAGPGGQSLSLGVPAYRLPIVNVAVAGLVGLSLFALLGFLYSRQRRLERHFRGESDYYAAVVRMRHRDGHWVWVYDRGRVISRTSDGKPHWVRGTHVDDTARHRLTEAERAWYGQFRMHANSVPGVLYQFRSDAEGNFSFPFVSDRLRAVHGCDAAEAFVSTVRNQERGTVRHIAVVHDISERLRYEDELRRLASYDTLTGLPNRRLLADRLHQAIAHATRTGEHFSVGMLDLDWFKPVNDRYGHEAGDEVLCVIARRLSNHLRAEDTIARLGGDEFVLVIRESADDGAIFDRILAAISEPIPLRGVGAIVNVSGSIGVAHFDADMPLQGDQLLRHADQAVYRAKASGREQIVTFEAMEAGSEAL